MPYNVQVGHVQNIPIIENKNYEQVLDTEVYIVILLLYQVGETSFRCLGSSRTIRRID